MKSLSLAVTTDRPMQVLCLDQLHESRQPVSNGKNSVLIQNSKKIFLVTDQNSICMEIVTACQFIISQSHKFLKTAYTHLFYYVISEDF